MNSNPLDAHLRRISLFFFDHIRPWCFDVPVAVVALILLSPVFLTIAIILKIESPDEPVFFTTERIGLWGKIFLLFKFRSMKSPTEPISNDQFIRDHFQDRERITPFGDWLRRKGLDELPQLANVVLRDMNLVGPRPCDGSIQEGYERKIPGFHRRNNVRPGITGPTLDKRESSRPNGLEEKFRLDMQYIE
jgi:lipopolysaccharide/colanic/teichoic acid biosynthesis glycosyltransferase